LKIRFLPADHDAAGHYRCFFPGFMLHGAGHDVEDAPHCVHLNPDQSKVTKSVHVYALDDIPGDTDVVVLHNTRDMNIFSAGVDARLVYVIDDGLLDMPSWHPARDGFDARVVRSLLGRCDGVVASTAYLAEQASGFNSNVHLVRNRLYWPMWEQAGLERVGGRVRVGWMGGFSWRREDLKVLRGLLPQFLRRNPHVDFVAAGDPPVATHDFLGIPGDRRVSVDGFPFGKNYLRLRELLPFDVGVVPLASSLFNEAKSHLKGMEYNACGIPYVASDTESYRHYTREGVNGFVVKKPRQWLSRLEDLVNDHELRERMGRSAREEAERHKVEDHWQEWERAYSSVL